VGCDVIESRRYLAVLGETVVSIFNVQSQKTVIFVVTAMKTPDVKLITVVSKRHRIFGNVYETIYCPK